MGILEHIERQVGELIHKVDSLERKVKTLMADLSGVQTAVDQIEALDAEAAAELQALAAEVAQLTAGAVSQDQLDSLAGRLNSASTALASAVTAAKGPPPPPVEEPAPPPPPVEEPAPPPPPVEEPAPPPPVEPPAEPPVEQPPVEPPPQPPGLHVDQVE